MQKSAIFNYNKRWGEAWQFVALLSFRKVFNYCKILFAYWISLLIKRPVIIGMPASLSIETSAICNLRCPQCPAGNNELNRSKGLMDMVLFKKIIDDAGKYLISITLHLQGEPFCNPELVQMIAYACKKRIFTVLSTNGHFLTEKDTVEQLINAGLNRIIISLDGITQKSYGTYRVGGQLQKVEGGIQKLTTTRCDMRKANPYIVIQTLVFAHNESELETIRAHVKSLKADAIQFKTAQFYHFSNNDLVKIPTQSAFSRYKRDENGALQLKRKAVNWCFRLWVAGVVTWDGKVLPCCYDKDAEFIFGNIHENTLVKILKSPESRRFRNKVLSNINQIGICSNCNK